MLRRKQSETESDFEARLRDLTFVAATTLTTEIVDVLCADFRAQLEAGNPLEAALLAMDAAKTIYAQHAETTSVASDRYRGQRHAISEMIKTSIDFRTDAKAVELEHKETALEIEAQARRELKASNKLAREAAKAAKAQALLAAAAASAAPVEADEVVEEDVGFAEVSAPSDEAWLDDEVVSDDV